MQSTWPRCAASSLFGAGPSPLNRRGYAMLEATLHHAAKMQSMHGDSSLEAHGALSLAQRADADGLLEDYWEQARDDTEPLPSAREMLDETE